MMLEMIKCRFSRQYVVPRRGIFIILVSFLHLSKFYAAAKNTKLHKENKETKQNKKQTKKKTILVIKKQDFLSRNLNKG